jgi:TolB-like protein
MVRPLLFAALMLLALPARAGAPRTVAISYFDVNAQSPEYEPLRKGLADMLITDLGAVKSLQIVERARLNQVLDELKLSKSPFIDPASAQKLGKGLSADFLMTGGLTVLQGTMRIDARLVTVETGKVAASQEVTGKQDEFFALEKELVELLVKTLDPPLELSEKSKLRKSQTESFTAFTAYSQGLDATDRGESEKARAAYLAAVQADPQYQAAKAAVDHLKSALKVHESKKAGDWRSTLARLDPADSDFGKEAHKLFDDAGGNGSPVERQARRLDFLAYLAEQGWKPYEKTLPRTPIEPAGRRYLEAHEVLDLIGSWGSDAEVLDQTPAVMEYLLTKYPDDDELPEQLEHHAKNVAAALASDKRHPGSTYEEAGERAAAVHALLSKLAAKHQAALKKADASPRATLERVSQSLAAEHARRDAAFDAEFVARVRALDPKDEKYSDEVGDLIYAAENHPVREQRLPRKLELLDRVFSQNGRPRRGTADSPVYLEFDQLLQVMNQYDGDPDTVALLPPVGEYLLAKYPDHPYIASQLALTSKSIARTLSDPERSRRNWKAENDRVQHRAAEAQARALFKKIGSKAKR